MTDEAAGPAKSSGAWATFRDTPRTAKALLAGVFVNSLAGFIQIFLILFLTHQGFSSGQASFALGLYGVGAVLGTFVGGWLTDRLTVRTIVAVSTLGSALLMVAILYLKSYPLVLIAVLLVSGVRQLYRPAAQAMLTRLTPSHQLIMVMAMYRLALNLGTSAAPVIGVALIAISYNVLFWTQAAAAVIYALIALIALPSKTRSTGEPAHQAVAPTPGRGYLTVLSDLRFTAFLIAILLRGAVYVQYTTALPLAIQRAGVSLWWYSAVVSLNAIVIVTCEVFLTRFTQHWPLRVTAVTAFGLLAVGYAAYAIKIVPAILIIGTLIWTLSEIIGAPTAFAYPSMVAPPKLLGRYIGSMQSALGIGMTIGPIVGIWLLNGVGRWAWIWMGGVAVLSTVAARIGMSGPAMKTAPEQDAEPPPKAAVKTGD